MKFAFKILPYLFLASTLLIFGYQAVKYSRDIVRVWNAKTLTNTLIMYESKNSNLPESSQDNFITKVLYQKALMSSEIRDPVFISSTVILDEYAHMFLRIFAKISQFVSTEAQENMNSITVLSKQNEIDPELVFAFAQNKGKFEVSVKLESPFSAGKMNDDQGNDPERYEVGTDLSIDTSLFMMDGKVQAKNPQAQVIR